MREYTVADFCLTFGILYYDSDVLPFAYSEEWFRKIEIFDDDGNAVDTVEILDEKAINDTLSRMHAGFTIETIGKYIIA